MLKYRVPNEQEQRILRENGLDPNAYAVVLHSADTIHLLCYKTRDEITINRGDRPWRE